MVLRIEYQPISRRGKLDGDKVEDLLTVENCLLKTTVPNID